MAFKFTEEQLNTLDKSFIVNLFLQLQDQNDKLSGEIQELNKKMEVLIEQITLANKNRFGRSSEKMTDTAQICFMEVDGTIVFFNEAEAVSDLDAEEPDTLESKLARKSKTVGKKEADIKGLPVNVINHYMTEEELTAEFGENGWKQLPDAISKRYRFIPAKVEIDEHHVGVYAGKKDGRILKADHPKALLHGSLVSPTIAAAIMNGKYVNAVPLYRLEQEFSRYGLTITRQNMANWMIRLGESYLAVLYDYLHQKLYDYHVIQADETPVLVNRDGRSAGSKSYMWVYRSGHLYADKQIVLYDYQKTRNSSHPRKFLRDYSGICVTDEPDVLAVAEDVVEKVGYQAGEILFDALIHQQSPDIAQGVQNSMESRKQHVAGEEWKMGAGDQGVMTGYACSETKQFLPLPVVLAHRIVRELSACRISEYIRGLLPDGKAQITVEYEDGKPVRLDTVIVSCQHAEEKSQKDLEREIRQKVLRPALRLLPPDEDTRILINPSGKFVVGGLDADTGLTGRKLMVDCYGSIAPHGGGAFSGKDATKVDRSGAYMARYIAKNMVAAGLAEKCLVSLAYAIGVAEPVMVQVDTFGTGTVCADDCLAAAIPLVFGLTPKQIIDHFKLQRPIYSQTAVFGHFGRKEFPWERTDKVEALRSALL